jgi:hypothetical protein
MTPLCHRTIVEIDIWGLLDVAFEAAARIIADPDPASA